MKSASELLHGLLMKEKVGFKFTMQTVKDMAAEAEMDVTQGEVTGFIYRALRFGRVQVVGKVKGNEGRMLHQYEILDREPWSFKSKSHGSNKGRTIKNRQYNPVPEIQGQAGEQLKLVLTDDRPAPVESLYMRLFDLAAEVEALEKKSLKDYSTDELIAELKTRVK